LKKFNSSNQNFTGGLKKLWYGEKKCVKNPLFWVLVVYLTASLVLSLFYFPRFREKRNNSLSRAANTETVVISADSIADEQNEYSAVYQEKTKQTPKKSTYDNTRPNPYPYVEERIGTFDQVYYIGPKGGEYYVNQNGNRTYYNSAPAGKDVFVGPNGGEYYYSDSGKKVYIRKK
jgi:hypothetical protein